MTETELRAERLRRRWSQAELGRRSGLNANTISQIELGRLRPYANQIQKLEAAFAAAEPKSADDVVEEACPRCGGQRS